MNREGQEKNLLVLAIQILAGLTGLYQFIIASRILNWLGIFLPGVQHRAISLTLGLVLIYFSFNLCGQKKKAGLAWYDVLFLTAGLVGVGYIAVNYHGVLKFAQFGYLKPSGIVLALLAAVAILEAVRRVSGWILPILILVFLFFTKFQNILPGSLNGPGFGLDRLAYDIYIGAGGIFGTPLAVATTILIVYIIFAALLQKAGAGQWFIDIALPLTGWSKGGPAKAAVVASGFFGMISGSPTANVASVGTFTIPLMKRLGYSARFAGGVEAVASTGGQIMPPVMGSIAFIMAQWLGISYFEIAKAAFIPACIYFIVLFMSIHFEAGRLNLPAMHRNELPALGATFKKGWPYLIPLVTLILLLLVMHFPPETAAIYSSLVLIAVSFLLPDREKHLTPRRIWAALTEGVNNWLTIGAITAAVGMLVGSLEMSGLGIKFSGFMLDLSGGNLLLTLVLVGLASFILGMGLDSIPAYMTLATLAAPALSKLGIPDLVAHLYVIYWGLASFITPPVCIAVYVSSGISGSDIWETGWEAVRLGIASFIVPFAFVYNRALLMQGSAGEIVVAFITAIAGATLVAAALRGYAIKSLVWPVRIILLLAGFLLIGPGVWTAVLGVALAVISLTFNQRFVGLNKNPNLKI